MPTNIYCSNIATNYCHVALMRYFVCNNYSLVQVFNVIARLKEVEYKHITTLLCRVFVCYSLKTTNCNIPFRVIAACLNSSQNIRNSVRLHRSTSPEVTSKALSTVTWSEC